jgi:hypothetical protein
MMGVYENFPLNIHRIEILKSSFSTKKLQEKLVRTLHEINRKPFGLEEIGHQALQKHTVILEVGIAEGRSFNYIDDEETKKVLNALKKESFRVMDFFVALRYYKNKDSKKQPLRFDYFMLRFIFGENNSVELQVFHERGPRHTSPEDIATFLVSRVNEASARKILKNEPSEKQ